MKSDHIHLSDHGHNVPKDWELTPLKSLGDFLRGSNISKADLVEEGLPCVLYGEIYTRHDNYIRQFYSYIDQKTAARSTRIFDGDLLFAGSGETPEEIGKCVAYLGREEAYAGGDLIILRLKKGDSRFFGFLLNGEMVNRQKYQFAQGHSVVHIYSEQLGKLVVPIPPLPEQRKIAEILGTWDEAIRLTADLIAAKQQRKKGLMQRLLTGAVRFPQFKASNWKTENVGDLVTPISRNEKIDKDKTYRLIGVRWYLAGAHIHSEIRGNMIEATSLSRIEAGDILYNKMWVTKSAFAVAKQEHIGCYGTSEYPQFQAKKQFLLPEFIEYAFNNPKFLHDATTLCRGTTGRARLNPTDFLKLELLLPPVAEQREIASFLQACDHEIDLLQQKHAALQQQKKGLMQRLLTGQVRVKV